jgi:WD40 repeat protein
MMTPTDSKAKCVVMLLCIAGSAIASAMWFVASARADSNSPQQARTDSYGDPLPEGSQARLGTVRFRETGAYAVVVLAPDGKTIATATQAGSVRLLNAATGKLIRQLQVSGPGSQQQFLAFSGDGGRLAGIWPGGGVQVWEAATGALLRQLRTGRGVLPGFALSGEGKTLAVANYEPGSSPVGDGGVFGAGVSVKVWDVDRATQVGTVGPLPNTWRLHAAFAPDGKVLATWGQQKWEHQLL